EVRDGGEGRSSISGRLRQAVFVGTDFRVILELADGSEIKATIRDQRRDRVAALRSGDTVELWYPHSGPHVIPQETSA
ncbi:MAG: TOBE domain-containing protein, partial [Candidatus Zixiibacteriota bacterium]